MAVDTDTGKLESGAGPWESEPNERNSERTDEAIERCIETAAMPKSSKARNIREAAKR